LKGHVFQQEQAVTALRTDTQKQLAAEVEQLKTESEERKAKQIEQEQTEAIVQ
jgi:hypothetical protein